MRKFMIVVVLVLFVLSLNSVFAQGTRKPQFEVFAGVGIPLAPEDFKDYFKVGFSGHAQYVLFPSPQMGVVFGAAYEKFTFDGDKLLEEMGLSGSGVDVSGSASIVELGIGVRPYLTPVESNNQFFLFGMATYNFLSEKAEVSYQGISASADTSYNKFGLAAGAGFEFPAGTSVNIIVQGVFRFIFTESYTDDFGDKYGGVTTFVGITGGVAF
jgi:hypothetical protein